MSNKTSNDRGDNRSGGPRQPSHSAGNTVVVVGGNGGLQSKYREVVEERGWSLRHYERRLPPGVRRTAGKIALVVIMVGMVSHPLRAQAQELASRDKVPILYLRTPSVSALRHAVSQAPGE